MLLLFALVDRLQAALKAPRDYHAGHTKVSSSEGGTDESVARVKERLQRYDQPLLKELVAILNDFEEELLPAADATELLDAMGWLSDVLGESPDANTFLSLSA